MFRCQRWRALRAIFSRVVTRNLQLGTWIWRKIHQRRWLRDADLAPLLVELPQKRELFGIPPTSSSPEVNTRDPLEMQTYSGLS